MSTAILFFLAAILLIGFVVIKIVDPSSEAKKTREELIDSIDPDKEMNLAPLFLKIGPVFFGFGLIGYLIRQYWDLSGARLILVSVLLAIFLAISYGLYFYNKTANKSYLKLYTEASMLVSSFLIGTTLFAINGFVNDTQGFLPFGAAEIFGIWTLFTIPFVYLNRSAWLQVVNVGLSIFWLSIYLHKDLNLIRALNFDLVSYQNQTVFLVLPVVVGIIYILLYSWHQKNKHNEATSPYRPMYYISGLLGYLTIGSLIMHALTTEYYNFYNNFNLGIFADVMMAICVVSAFVIDYIFKKSFKDYNINYLVPILVSIALVCGLLFTPTNPFLPFLFLEVPFIVWLLADYLRQNSQLAQLLFYGFSSIQLFLIATDTQTYNWLKMVTLLAILIYAAIVHFTKRGFVFYVLIAGLIATIFKVIALQAKGIDGFLLIMVIGGIVSVYGIFFAQTRNKLRQIKNK